MTSKDWLAAHHRKAFGGNREAVLERDGYACVDCGLTDTEHRKRWGRAITIHHKDGNGKGKPVKYKNNDLNNLETLCLSCHMKKDKELARSHNGVCTEPDCNQPYFATGRCRTHYHRWYWPRWNQRRKLLDGS